MSVKLVSYDLEEDEDSETSEPANTTGNDSETPEPSKSNNETTSTAEPISIKPSECLALSVCAAPDVVPMVINRDFFSNVASLCDCNAVLSL